ncbi:putative 2-aminoethylphosphonate ABC transporter substrate-binding protein [soil metagenome]
MSTLLRRINLRLIIALLIVLGCIWGVYAFQPLTSTTQDADEITVYTALPADIVHGYLAAFQAEHPEIKVTLVNKVTLMIADQLLAEQDDPQADVIWGLAVTSMLPLEWAHLLTLYAPVGIARVGPTFRDVNEPPQWVGIAARSVVFCVNTDELAKRKLPKPESWQDLLKPVYKGHLLILAPGQTSVGYLLISTVLQMYGDTQGWEYLAQLNANADGHYANQANGVCRLVRDGKYPIGITYDYRASFPKEKSMTIVIPKEGTGWDLEVNALVRKESIKPAAKVFLDWAISDSAMQQYLHDRVITAATTDKYFSAGLSAEMVRKSLFDLDIPWIAANRERVQGEWTELFGAPTDLIDTSK